MGPNESRRLVLVDGGCDVSTLVRSLSVFLGIAPLLVSSVFLAENLNGIGRGSGVHGQLDGFSACSNIVDTLFEELFELGSLPALLVLVDVVFVLAPRSIHGLIFLEAQFD